jgi:hypothetical protein
LTNKYMRDYLRQNITEGELENGIWADIMDYSLITYGCLMQQGK